MDDMKTRAEELRSLCGSPDTDPRTLLSAAFELLGKLAERVDEQAADAKDTRAFVEELDRDLTDLEDAFYEDAEDPEEDGPEGDDGPSEEEDPDASDDGPAEAELIRYACPHCGRETVFRVEDIDLQDAPRCESCHELLFPDLE